MHNVFSILWGGEQRSTNPYTRICLEAQFIVESPPEAWLLGEGDSYDINHGVAEPVPHDTAWKCAALGRNTK